MMVARFKKIDKSSLWAALLVSIWFLVNLYLASQRSISCDEWPKFDYMGLGLKRALYMHLSELAPYAPGEIFLGAASKNLFGWFLPNEIWTRLPALGFGAATLALGFGLRLRFLVLPLLFSVTLTSFVTQFQPYAAMVFGGALAFAITHDENPEQPLLLGRLAWFNLFFGHIYGICFVALAQAFRRKWLEVAAGACGVVAILAVHFHLRRTFAPMHAEFPPAVEIIRQTGGTLTNPHKAAYLFLPLLAAGLVFLGGRRPTKLFSVAALLAATILAPMLASKAGDYMFLPRQIVGGVVPVLAVAALGFEWLLALVARKWGAAARQALLVTGWCLNIAASVLPWVLFVRGVPPFVDQPLHRLKALTREIVDSGATHVLWTETGTGSSGVWYFNSILGKASHLPAQNYRSHDLALQKDCWSRAGKPDFCVHLLTDLAFLYNAEHALGGSARVHELITSGDPVKFDAVVHSLDEFRNAGKVVVLRTW
ncbi:MAG: hypothetical protein HY074_04750 [Deltaproteobacteria bacterium]|nr:hypothetical protein [Deltaproteobacteria bacterium]